MFHPSARETRPIAMVASRARAHASKWCIEIRRIFVSRSARRNQKSHDFSRTKASRLWPIYVSRTRDVTFGDLACEIAEGYNLHETGTERNLYVEMLEIREISNSTRFYDFNYRDRERIFIFTRLNYTVVALHDYALVRWMIRSNERLNTVLFMSSDLMLLRLDTRCIRKWIRILLQAAYNV